jgi:NADH:ubiquinone reductase (H+-translocating)
MADKPHVVIIGGGFGGLHAAKALKRVPVRVTLIDKRNHHLFQPLLYQVATAGLAAPDIATPIRKVLKRQKNATVLLVEVSRIDVNGKRLLLAGPKRNTTDHGEVAYDYLVVATGATHSYFDHPEWEEFAPGLKTIDDALEICRRILLAFEKAERTEDSAERERLMTFVVVGAGPTGVELAGAVSEIARRTLARDFRNVDPAKARVILLEGADRVLPPYAPSLSTSAREQLVELGVEVRTGAKVTAIDERGVSIGDERIEAATILWGAGVAASPLGKSLDAPLDKAGRVEVEPDLSVPEHKELFVVGDLAAAKLGDGIVPGVAPAAIQMGRHTARNIRQLVAGRPTRPFRYIDKGMLATIGRSRAVAQIGRLRMSGWIAWMLWLIVHIFFLIGFRNRVMVLMDWTAAYIAFNRGARIILEERNKN